MNLSHHLDDVLRNLIAQYHNIIDCKPKSENVYTYDTFKQIIAFLVTLERRKLVSQFSESGLLTFLFSESGCTHHCSLPMLFN